jgi:hypothetical protein
MCLNHSKPMVDGEPVGAPVINVMQNFIKESGQKTTAGELSGRFCKTKERGIQRTPACAQRLTLVLMYLAIHILLTPIG